MKLIRLIYVIYIIYQYISGTRCNDKEKSMPWIPMKRTFPKLTFLHPVKWSPILHGSQSHTDFFCRVVVPWIYNSTETVPSFKPKIYAKNITYFYKSLNVLN